MIACIHGHPISSSDRREGTCLDCEELTSLRELEAVARHHGPFANGTGQYFDLVLERLDDIRRRKGIGALGHPETRDLEAKARRQRDPLPPAPCLPPTWGALVRRIAREEAVEVVESAEVREGSVQRGLVLHVPRGE